MTHTATAPANIGKLFRCKNPTCNNVIGVMVENGLKLNGGIVVGKTPILCSQCGQKRVFSKEGK